MNIQITTKDGIPIYRQLFQQIERQVASGRLRPGDQLPPVRKLAEELVINPNTVARTYRELESAGILSTRQGSGVFIRKDLPPLSQDERTQLLADRVKNLLEEAQLLGVCPEALIELIQKQSETRPPL